MTYRNSNSTRTPTDLAIVEVSSGGESMLSRQEMGISETHVEMLDNDSARRFETKLQCGLRTSALDGDSSADDTDIPTIQRSNPLISVQP